MLHNTIVTRAVLLIFPLCSRPKPLIRKGQEVGGLGFVAFYDILTGNGVCLFLKPWSQCGGLNGTVVQLYYVCE